MANTGKKIYQFLKQVNATTGLDTGLKKTNNPSDPDYVAPTVDYVKCPIVGWKPIAPFCVTSLRCAVGWTLVNGVCTKIEEQPAQPPSGGGTPGIAIKANNQQWNTAGARVYNAGYGTDGNGSTAVQLLTPHLWLNGTAIGNANNDRNAVDSRMNAAGIWCTAPAPSLNEYIGFVRKVTVTTAHTVYIGMAADNKFKFSVNGNVLVAECENLIGVGSNFNEWNIYPVALQAGDNYIEMWGANTGSAAAMAAEVYDCTLAELGSVETEQELQQYIIFSTANMVGESFDLGTTAGYSCPTNWYLAVEGGSYLCRKKNTAQPSVSNTGMQGYSERERLKNGISDGYSEPNLQGTGIGPYFDPALDTIACPIN